MTPHAFISRLPTVGDDPCLWDAGNGYWIWQCFVGDWYVYHNGQIVNDTLYRGLDTPAQALELMAYHRRRTMKAPKKVSNVRSIPQPKKGAGEVTMACHNKAGGKNKK